MRRFAQLAAALVLSTVVSTVAALQVNPLDETLVSVHLSASGHSRAEAELQAQRIAVTASAGRVLLDDKLFRADDLLQRYLDNYAPRFVTGVEVLKDTFTGGQTVLECRVFVDHARLVADLEEKRFVYRPAYRPQFAIFMEERLEGTRTDVEVARKLLETALQVEGMRAYQGAVDEPSVTVDVATTDDLMRSARMAAERRNVEIIITGETNTWLRDQRQLYYDNFFFYDCEMKVQAIRVDTGEVFAATEGRNSGAAKDQADAVRLAIERTAAGIARDVEDEYSKFWGEVVQAKVDYEILLTATDAELTGITSEYLRRLGVGTVINTRKAFGPSAVITITTTAGRDAVLEALRASPYPVLNVVREVGNRKFEVQVSG